MITQETSLLIEKVPEQFNLQAAHPYPYPEDNYNVFEEWYFKEFDINDRIEHVYLPIFWTGYYVRANYGKNKQALKLLQNYIDGLDRGKKYYTIVQYDDGILNDVSALDIKVFSMSGQPRHYPLPLICPLHTHRFEKKRETFVNFVGKETHPLRKKVIEVATNASNYSLGSPSEFWYISTRTHTMKDFCEILASSVFTLCPRGYGPTSFRIMEALQYGSIPVYISDEFIYPHREIFKEYGVVIQPGQISALRKILTGYDKREIERLQNYGKSIFDDLYTYDGTKKRIIRNLLPKK